MSKIDLLKEKADKLGLLVLVCLETYKGKAILPSTLPSDAEEDNEGIYCIDKEREWKQIPAAL